MSATADTNQRFLIDLRRFQQECVASQDGGYIVSAIDAFFCELPDIYQTFQAPVKCPTLGICQAKSKHIHVVYGASLLETLSARDVRDLLHESSGDIPGADLAPHYFKGSRYLKLFTEYESILDRSVLAGESDATAGCSMSSSLDNYNDNIIPSKINHSKTILTEIGPRRGFSFISVTPQLLFIINVEYRL